MKHKYNLFKYIIILEKVILMFHWNSIKSIVFSVPYSSISRIMGLARLATALLVNAILHSFMAEAQCFLALIASKEEDCFGGLFYTRLYLSQPNCSVFTRFRKIGELSLFSPFKGLNGKKLKQK